MTSTYQLRAIIFAAATAVAVASAWLMRYEPLTLPGVSIEIAFVWDRWLHRVCMVGTATNQRIVCDLREFDEFGRRNR